MPTKRRRVGRNIGIAITPTVLTAFVAGDEVALAIALRWRPWLPSPLYVHDDEPTAPTPPEWWARRRTRAPRSLTR